MIKKALVFMLCVSFVVTLALPSAAMGKKPRAARADIVIQGQNDPTIDVQAVQNAVSSGGTVYLSGTFDFGADGSVSITNNVEIVGETGTTINGGTCAFYSPLPGSFPPNGGPNIKISGIYFTGAKQAAILIRYANGVQISGNKIENVIPVKSSLWFPDLITGQLFNACLQSGINVSTIYTQQGIDIKPYPGAITGVIDIKNNNVDMTFTDSGDITHNHTLGLGIDVVYATNAQVNISGNTVKNATRNSIETVDNYMDETVKAYEKKVVVEDNNIETAIDGCAYPTSGTPNGIVAGVFFNPGWFAVTEPSLISHNSVKEVGNRKGAYAASGIILLNNVEATNNNVVVSGNPTNFGIVAVGNDSYIGQNKIEGQGFSALVVSPSVPFDGDNNVLVGNNIDNFTPIFPLSIPNLPPNVCPKVMFNYASGMSADSNVIVGGSGQVLNMGVNNKIRGGYTIISFPWWPPAEGGVGQQISDALSSKLKK